VKACKSKTLAEIKWYIEMLEILKIYNIKKECEIDVALIYPKNQKKFIDDQSGKFKRKGTGFEMHDILRVYNNVQLPNSPAIMRIDFGVIKLTLH